MTKAEHKVKTDHNGTATGRPPVSGGRTVWAALRGKISQHSWCDFGHAHKSKLSRLQLCLHASLSLC